MSGPPADGEYWVVIRLADGERAVAVATSIGLGMEWTLLDDLAPASDVVPVFRVNLLPEPLRVWEWYAVVDPVTRKRGTARLVPLGPYENANLGWDMPGTDEPVPQVQRFPLWPLHSL